MQNGFFSYASCKQGIYLYCNCFKKVVGSVSKTNYNETIFSNKSR
jgi:hypothetical protein